ncbi:MAG TPA: cyclase [Actinobacteria bacterium]|nr:cyclase [Actinomycetota bacterium]
MGSDRSVDALRDRISNWGRWGKDDELGTVNLITESVRRAAGKLVQTGETVSLALPLNRQGLQRAGDQRLNPQHIMLQTGTDLKAGVQPGQVGGWGYADDMVAMALQAATHWDSLAHAFYEYRMYNDRRCDLVTSNGAERNSIDKMSDRIVTRGVLLDFPLVLGHEHLPMDYRISTTEIEAVLEAAGTEARPGDILLFRTGNMKRARANGGWDDYSYTDEPGIGIESLPWLHERDIAAVACDTWAFECLPGGSDIWLPVHAAAIVYMGLLIGENFFLDGLAAACERKRRWEFLIAAPPLPFTKAVGSPVNPLAVF